MDKCLFPSAEVNAEEDMEGHMPRVGEATFFLLQLVDRTVGNHLSLICVSLQV